MVNNTYSSGVGENCDDDNYDHEIQNNEDQICDGELEISNGSHERDVDDDLADPTLMEIEEGRIPQIQSSPQHYFVRPGMIESASESESEMEGQEAPLSEPLPPGSTNCDPCSFCGSPSETAPLGTNISSFLELLQIHMQPRI